MAKAKRLGRGLEALISQGPAADYGAAAGSGMRTAPLDRISVNPYQPRRTFDDEKMRELTASIREHGVVQPVLLRSLENGYQLIAGERRVRAARDAGLKEIPALVREMTDHEMMEVSLVENIQRQDLDPVEEARAYKRLSEEFGQTQERIAGRVSRSRSYIANSMRLLQLPDAVLHYLVSGALTVGHARPLLMLSEDEALRLAERIIGEGATARDAEQWAKQALAPAPEAARGETPQPAPGESATKKQLPPELKEIQRLLREAVNTKVEITSGAKGGKIIIEYYTQDDIEHILELLTGSGEI